MTPMSVLLVVILLSGMAAGTRLKVYALVPLSLVAAALCLAASVWMHGSTRFDVGSAIAGAVLLQMGFLITVLARGRIGLSGPGRPARGTASRSMSSASLSDIGPSQHPGLEMTSRLDGDRSID